MESQNRPKLDYLQKKQIYGTEHWFVMTEPQYGRKGDKKSK